LFAARPKSPDFVFRRHIYVWMKQLDPVTFAAAKVIKAGAKLQSF
jgi:hypothetical protein